MPDGTADVVVIGLGAMGSATLYRLAQRGLRVIGIDRHHPPHDQGSSHGESRITRLAVGEGADYVPLVRRSHALWREMEAETGKQLMLQTGGLLLAPREGAALHHGQDDFVRRTIDIARRFDIAHEVLDAAAIEARFPQFVMRGDEIGYYEPEAGMLFPENCIAAQLELARRAGATILTGETVLGVEDHAGGVTVTTDRGRYAAGEAVLSPGAWLQGLAGDTPAPRPRVYRQSLHWFAPDDPAAFAPGRFPIFIWMHGNRETDYLYGFPMLPGSTGVKLASEQYVAETTPDTVHRVVTEAESAAVFAEQVAGRIRGVTPRPTRTGVCLYTVTPDAGFIVDHLPGRQHVRVVSACSGHGFKHSAAMGEAVAAAVLGEAHGLAPFALGRFAA
jgi:sarcosine oxidase